jgi:hypothetical protein
MVVRAEVSSPDLADLAVAIKYEQDGAVMRRELLRNLRTAVKPAVEEAKSSIMALPAGGLRQRGDGTWHLGSAKQKGGSMRAAIRKQVTTEVNLTQKSAKVKVKVRKRNMPRGFTNAPKAYQLAKGWRHPVFPGAKGHPETPNWVAQIGKPGWFDVPLRSHRAQYRAAVQAAMNHTADRIARKV